MNEPVAVGLESESRDLINRLLFDQSRLTAVETFAARHEQSAIDGRQYRDLIPSASAAGHQYAFEVNLDKCSGCKACVTACHALNGLDANETWREVGLLVSDDWRRPFQQVVTTACHHCLDPGCLNGCPVLAYEKDPVTGIVRHLDDQCIGCQYCVLKCPYEVPQYSASRGIVRKCDMCSQRLEIGEAPACAQACPNEAIRITLVNQDVVRAQYRSSAIGAASVNQFLAASPDPGITLPATRYISKRPLSADLVPCHATVLPLQPAHWPLVVMLVFTQFSAGSFALLLWLPDDARLVLAVAALTAGMGGLAASILHLGRPLKAWRSFLGLRKSWLSREIVAFGIFVPVAGLAAAGLCVPSWIPVSLTHSLLCLSIIIAPMAVWCSAMIYHDTQRIFWRGIRSVGRFLGTTAVLALAGAWLATAATGHDLQWLAGALAAVATLKWAGEHRLLRRCSDELAEKNWPAHGEFDAWSLTQSAVLMRDQLGLATRVRFFFLIAGGILLPLLSVLRTPTEWVLAAASVALCLPGELAERYLFFRAVAPPRMPGVG